MVKIIFLFFLGFIIIFQVQADEDTSMTAVTFDCPNDQFDFSKIQTALSKKGYNPHKPEELASRNFTIKFDCVEDLAYRNGKPEKVWQVSAVRYWQGGVEFFTSSRKLSKVEYSLLSLIDWQIPSIPK